MNYICSKNIQREFDLSNGSLSESLIPQPIIPSKNIQREFDLQQKQSVI